MLTVHCIAACDIAENADRSRILHMKPGLVADLLPTRDLALALRAGVVKIEGRPPPADIVALEGFVADLDVEQGKARMDAALAAQVRADAAALVAASDADIVATVAAQQAPPSAPAPAVVRPARAPRGRK